MSTYRRYQDARDASWRALLRLDVRSLPVDARNLAPKLGAVVLPFPNSAEEPRLAALISQASDAPCVSLRIRGAWHIFLCPGLLDEKETRFAIAHELGHLALQHETYALAPGVRAFRARENAGDLLDDPLTLDDYAADIFALRLLAPACVLHALNAGSPSAIADLCGLPPRAAAQRAERMALLERRNAFFIHPLEKQVWAQFQPFIQSHRPAAVFIEDAPPRPALPTFPAPRPSSSAPAKHCYLSRIFAHCKIVVTKLAEKLLRRKRR